MFLKSWIHVVISIPKIWLPWYSWIHEARLYPSKEIERAWPSLYSFSSTMTLDLAMVVQALEIHVNIVDTTIYFARSEVIDEWNAHKWMTNQLLSPKYAPKKRQSLGPILCKSPWCWVCLTSCKFKSYEEKGWNDSNCTREEDNMYNYAT